MERVCESLFILSYNSLNWLNLYDADAYFHFRVLIQILDGISIPNHYIDSFSLIMFEYFTLMERVCESQFKLVA